jgi:hypothetical protein
MKNIPSAHAYEVALHEAFDRLSNDKKKSQRQKKAILLLLKALYNAPRCEASLQELACEMEFPATDYSNYVEVANKVMGPMRALGNLLFKTLKIKPDVDPA